MNREELVRMAMERGVMLSPDLLQTAPENELEKLIAESDGESAVLATTTQRTQMTVRTKKPRSAEKLTPADIARFYSKKYTTLRDIIQKKIKAVSINKAPDMFSDVSVIGMVRELTSRGFVLEDPTGEIEVIGGKEALPPKLDDVLGVKGFVREGRIFQTDTVLPDVPLDNAHASMSGICAVLSAGPTKTTGDLVFTTEPQKDSKAICLDVFPAQVTIAKGSRKLLIVAHKPPEPGTPKHAVEWLKKRYLPHTRGAVASPDNPFLIKTVPDILWVVGGEQGKENYKGVTIVSCGSGDVKISLETMEAEFHGRAETPGKAAI